MTPEERATLDRALALAEEATALLRELRARTATRPGAESAAADPTPRFALLTVDDAARRYPIGRDRLRALVRAGTIPSIVIENPTNPRILVRPAAIEAYLRSLERAHGGPS
jgi:hypothetical protein